MRVLAGVSAAQHRADARQQLARAEGLGEVVIGAELESHHPVGFLAHAGEDDHRDLRLGAQLAQQLHAVLAAQTQIEQHQVDHVAAEDLHEFGTAGAAGDTERVLPEVLLDQLAHRRVVIDHQHVAGGQGAHVGRHP